MIPLRSWEQELWESEASGKLPQFTKSEPGLCARLDCPKAASGKSKYCSKSCSAVTRNRRYFLTLNGRWKKRAAASRYFQNHKQDLYDRKAARFERHCLDVERGINKYKASALIMGMGTGRWPERNLENLYKEIRRLARGRYDRHPAQTGDGPMGRKVWIVDYDTKQLRREVIGR